MAAVLTAGKSAALSHLSAALLWRMWRGSARICHVVAIGQRRLQPGLRVHASRRLDPRDVTCHCGVPVTTVARTLVDLSDVLDAQRLANVIHEAAFRGCFDAAATRHAMDRARGRHRLAALADALAVHAGGGAGTRSEMEDAFLALVRAQGLPEPLVNTGVHAGGRRIDVDFHWPDRRLCVEIDGPGHERPRTQADDRARDRLLCIAGHDVLRLTRDDLERRPEQVTATVQARLGG
jgi:very-short-patch-repair endonuclease